MVARHPGGESSKLYRILLRREIPAAAPGFIPHSPEAHVEWILEPGGGAHVSERGAAGWRVAIFHPAVELLGGQAAQVRCQVRLAADQFAEVYEFIGAELVGIISMTGGRFRRLALIPEIRSAGALVGRAKAIAPVITVRETPSRKAHDWRLDLAHFVDQFFANSIDVGNFRVGAHPHTVVHHAAQILREMAVDVRRNRPQRFVGQHFDSGVRGIRLRPRPRKRNLSGKNCPGPRQACAQKLTPFHHVRTSFQHFHTAAYGKRLPRMML